jgi:phage/plasmid-associated DNA primase
MTIFKILTNFKIKTDKLRVYKLFQQKFKEKTCKKLVNLMLSDKFRETFKPNHIILLERYKTFIKKDIILIKYNQRYKLGRHYCDDTKSIINLPRIMKHTIMRYLGWIDIDMVSAHPNFACEVGRRNGREFTYVQQYITNREQILQNVIDTYSIEENPITRDEAKSLFNIMAYGGGFNTWKTTDSGLDNKPIKEINSGETLHFINNYKRDCKDAKELIYLHNPDIVQSVKGDLEEKSDELKRRVCSYFYGIIENEILYDLYQFLLKKKLIVNGGVSLEYDGLCFKPKMDVDYQNEIDEFSYKYFDENNFRVNLKVKSYEQVRQDIIDDVDTFINDDDDDDDDDELLEPTDYEERNDKRVATTFLKFYGDVFIYEMEAHKTYFYNGVYWEEDEYKIGNYLCKNLSKKYEKQYDIIYDEGKKISRDDEEKYKNHQTTLKQISNFITSLSTTSHLKNYEEMIKLLIAKRVEFDVNPYLFAFNNVIWDLIQGKIIEPHPTQMISMTTGYDFEVMHIDTLNWKKQMLMDILTEIFPDKQVREYDLIIKSTGLTGIQVQNLVVSSGVGGNGKSILNALMMKSIGNYGFNLSSTCLVQEIKTGPNPEFANLHNKRYVVSGEPPDKKQLHMDTIKKLTGDSMLAVRGLYQTKCETKLRCTLDLDLNGLPKFDVVDEAVNRRLVAIPFESMFVDESRYELLKDKPNVFKMNAMYKEEAFQIQFRQILFMILMDYLPNFLKTGLLPPPPQKCKNLSNVMLANSDDLFDWFSNTFKRNDSNILSFGEIYDTYKTSSYFMKLSKKSQREQNRSKFVAMIETNLFLKDFIKRRKQSHNGNQLTKDVLVGWILKKDEDDNDDN